MENSATPSAPLPVLVATKDTQGQRKNDFCWCDEDEPVRFTFECDGERVDGRCGCRRSMSGLLTHKATTTMRVKNLPMTRSEYVALLKNGFEESGFPLDDASLQDEADQLLRLAAVFPTTAILEKRGDAMQVRSAIAKAA